MSGGWLVLWLRALRSELLRGVGVGALVLGTVLLAASVPRVLGRASDDALHGEIAAATPPERDIELVQSGRIQADPSDPLHLVEAAGSTLEGRYPGPIPGVVSAGSVVVDTPLWHPSAGTPLDSVLNLRIQQDVEAHLTLTSGRLPTGATRTIPDPTPGAAKDSVLVVFEVAASSQTAAKLGVPLGGRLILEPEPSDPLAAHRGIRLAVDLVGTFNVTDPSDPYWLDDASVAHTYTYALQLFVEYVGATMLLAPEAYPALMDATAGARLPMTYRWRSYVDPSAVQSAAVDPLSDALRRAETIYPPANPALAANGNFSGPSGMSPASLQTGLLRLLEAHQARWQSGATILTILWTGAGLVIVASLALVAEVVGRRRRATLAVVRRRGASAVQVAIAVLGEAVVLVLPAAIIGTALAVALIPVLDPGPTLAVAGGVAIVAFGLVAAASLRIGAGPGGDSTPARGSRRAGSGRLVVEALIVGLAVVGAALLRGRAPAAAATASSPGGGSAVAGADPFLAAAPALVGLAAGIIAVRLLPLALGLFARAFARRRGLVVVLGLRRAARDGAVAAVLVVTLTATTVGAFASVLLGEIDAGARSASWQAVGADFRVSGTPDYLALFEAKKLGGVEAETAVSTESVALSVGGTRELIAVDPAGATAVAGGTPADPDLPASLLEPAGGRIPAIVSSAAGPGGIVVGQSFSVRIAGVAVPLVAVAVRDAYPGVAPDQAFVVVSSRQLGAVSGAGTPLPSTLLIRAPSLSVADIRAATADLIGVTVQGQADSAAALRTAPAVTAVALGILSATIAVLAYGLLTIVLAIALDTAGRRGETARLEILGLSGRQAIGLVLVEFAPAVLVGVLAGLGLGLGLIEFVGPGLGLPAVLGVAGLESAPPDVGRLILVGLVVLAVTSSATLLSTLLERQAQLAAAVRE